MKKFLHVLQSHLQEFINGSSKPDESLLKLRKNKHLIANAMKKHDAIHVIYQDKSFTGDIVKYDRKAGKLILKNFRKNMSAIISIADIDKLTLVPPTIKKSQHLRKK